MAFSRLRRYEDKKQERRLILAIGGSIGLLIFLALFGVKILINASLLIDKLRGNTPAQTTNQSQLILPPVLDPLPESTNSANLAITGRGQAGLTVLIYVNESEFKKIPVPKEGNFALTGLPFKEGNNTVSSKLTDDKGNTSDLSNVISTILKKTAPMLNLATPKENEIVTGETGVVLVSGKTDQDNSVTVNDRFVVIKSDSSFLYSYTLAEGDTTLNIIATDPAGNTTKVERRVSYHK